MRVRFWGTRGSIAKPGAGTVRYGGNTSCVEVRSDSGLLLVLDCGTGAHALGHALMAQRGPRRGHILITHTHWDHIQGFPFFAPLFAPGDEWDVYAPRGLRESLRETLAGQMQYTYFPITLEQFAATVRYHDLVEGEFAIGDIRVSTRYLNHPALTLGYRLEADGATLVYATDHEPHSRALAEGLAGELTGEDRRHAQFLAGADLLIHDAQYTVAEYASKIGWGHSTVDSVATLARDADVRRVALFHHDPHRDDAGLDAVVAAARRTASTVDLFAAAEGQTLDVRGAQHAVRHATAPPSPVDAESAVPCRALAQSVLVAVAQTALRERLADAARVDGFTVMIAKTPDEAVSLVRVTPPSLLLLGRRLGGDDGLELARMLRHDAADLPIVMVAARESEADRAGGAEAGVTDWLVAPFSLVYARTRIRAWALRQACRWVSAPAPVDEPDRVEALRRLQLLDTPSEERFDRLTRLARRVFDVPMALVTLVDEERQWFKSTSGIDIRETPREAAFCAYTIHGDDPFVVPDARLDPRFADNPLVAGEPRIRFYAGHPVRIGPHRIGTLCLGDHRPRDLSDADRRTLEDLAALVEQELARSRAS
ncbi:MAG TPA: MBL fold metallo-hydrolase [Methylomirabilota bacterium]|nr:MBL fold metallo-hydrolase [Methylomirabilota bacterium]